MIPDTVSSAAPIPRITATSRWRLAVSATALLLAATACSTRVRDPNQAAITPPAAGSSGPSGPEAAEPGRGAVTLPDGSTPEPSPAPGSGASGVATPTSTTARPSTASAGTKAPTQGATPARPGTGAARAADAGTGDPSRRSVAPAPGAGPATPPSPARSREPILVGNVGTYSGPVGSSTATAPQALQVWARAVNERGGLGGRPVAVVVGDDAGDPARSQALIKEFVEGRRVVAFVANILPVTLNAGVAYLERQRVPVIGGDLTNVTWNESPVLFPQGTGIDNLSMAVGKLMVTRNVASAGHERIGIIYCAETPGCPYGAEQIARGVQRFGGEVVYRGQTSIAQPDYTAECLQAQQRKVEALAMILDANSIARFTASCERQGFTPVWSSYSLGIADHQKSSPSVDGMLAVMPTFPWIESSTPATAEYQAAMRRFAPNLPLGPPTSNAWTAGKLFEAAAASLPEITTATLFDGLGRIRDETLGGLAPGLTFSPGKGAPSSPCYFVMRIAAGRWTAPQGSKVDCL